ncbi:hypothetical protein [Winogradskyella luteola]|uniref:Uncharacterized protein n=1 Tax=Winogradskyella luteola TaxID=2828330 RepID=A0A9X1F682_9FLAO|nr:hypothetical protein [Winogradskyella luteola]MBV7268004.1 hypothetical protein [Winogradskyella luteola]
MKNTVKQVEKKTEQKINLVEGMFKPSEASHIINALIDQKINYHKIQRLSLCEGNENCDTTYENSRIQELKQEKEVAKGYIDTARRENYEIVINGTLDITFIKK